MQGTVELRSDLIRGLLSYIGLLCHVTKHGFCDKKTNQHLSYITQITQMCHITDQDPQPVGIGLCQKNRF